MLNIMIFLFVLESALDHLRKEINSVKNDAKVCPNCCKKNYILNYNWNSKVYQYQVQKKESKKKNWGKNLNLKMSFLLLRKC